MCHHEAQTPVQQGHVSPARVHDYLRGGVANFRADREAAHRLLSRCPATSAAVRHNLQFQRRVVHHLAEQGVRQFIDLGSGIPAEGGIHDVVRAVASDSNIVLVDLDELATALGEELFRDTKGIAFVQQDIRDPEELFRDPRLRDTIDLDQPVALLLMTTGGHLSDEERPAALVDHYRTRIAPGSYLALSHPDKGSHPSSGVSRETREHAGMTVRSREEIASWLSGFELVAPGIVHTEQWRPEYEGAACECPYLAAVARKTVRSGTRIS